MCASDSQSMPATLVQEHHCLEPKPDSWMEPWFAAQFLVQMDHTEALYESVLGMQRTWKQCAVCIPKF